VTPERIRQIEQKALAKVREALRRKKTAGDVAEALHRHTGVVDVETTWLGEIKKPLD
jgi:hypothetical protein